ncbi:DedA family protein [Alicyclobacillus sp. TC]|uniref:DedA family protein n=1 Tax=Alicyclobacillus sp. TC TaxID=2606450 RepID=UPI001932AF0E|nr:DedA family protein [Alicyclobacillus sp. TC]QRF23033.1 DedA family protein [Alicyclobacillus sp. TC]
MHEIIYLLHTNGYFALYVMLLLEYLVLIIPGETTLTTSGALWKSGALHLQLPWMIVAATMGTFSGSMIAYAIGRILGRPVILKYGKYVFITPKRFEQSEALFRRYTLPTLILSRFIAVARDIIPYIAGIQKVRLRVFIPAVLLTSIVWTTTFLAAGSVIDFLWNLVRLHWKIYLLPALIVIGIGIYGYRLIHKKIESSLHVQSDTNEKSQSLEE